MRVGHVIAMLGALLALLGGTVLDWQHFELAGVTARGFEVPLAGQAILILAALALATSVAGLVTRRRYPLAGATLVAALFSFGWLVYGHLGKLDAFAIVPFEAVEMLGGYTLATWGALMMFVGPLVVLASEPAWNPRSRFLRVALLWRDTVIQEKVLQDARTLTIGDALGNDLVIPENALPSRFPLFRADRKGNYSIGLARELDGEITLNQQTLGVRDFAGRATDHDADDVAYVPIAAGDWGMLELGAMRVFFQFVSPDARRRRTGLVKFEETAWSSIAISFFAQATFVILGILMWDESFSRGAFVEQKRLPDIEAAVMLKEPEALPEIEDRRDEEQSSKAAGGEAGKFGDPDEDPDKRSRVPLNEARKTDRVDPRKVGLNDLLATNKLGGSGAISEIMSTTSEGMSNKLAVAMGGSDSDFVVGHGTDGMTFFGDRDGGGDDGVGRIHSQGSIDTGGPGIEASLGPRARRRVGTLEIQDGTAKGFCSQSQIASVVKRRAGAIRACYEQRLQVAKDLKGKLTVRWNIALDGSVDGVAAVANTLGDAATANCIFRNLRRMRFQKPDGGICVVQWPFVFSPG